MWVLFPKGIQFIRQALVVAIVLLAAGLILIALGWSFFWELWCFGLSLAMVAVALLRTFRTHEMKG